MELVFTFAVFLALALGIYLIFSPRAKSFSTKSKCLIFSAIIFCLAALWCLVYGPDKWVLIQAGAIIVVATLAGLLSSPKA